MFTRIIRMVLALTVMGCFAAASIHAETEVKNEQGKLAAKVNGVGIASKDFDRSLAAAQQQFAGLAAQQGVDIPANVKQEVMNRLVDFELMLQDAKKRGITVEGAMLNDRLNAFKGQFNENNTFSSFLEKNSVTEEEVKDQFHRQLTLQGLQEQLSKEFLAKISISETDTKEFYDANVEKFKQPEQVKASHILVKVEPDSDMATAEKARTKLEGIQQQIQAGSDFAELARANSDCPSSAQGGDLGFFGKGQMVKPFEDAAFSLKPNEISNIVETQFGFHLIKMAEKRQAETVPFDEVKQKISDYLKQVELDMTQQEYIKGLRENAKIETLVKLD